MARCLVISAPASGAGKTTLTLALARAFRDRGLAVQCFKSGPDYIDPAFHAAATGRASVNIDSWAMPRGTIDALMARGGDADLVLAEGSMGLFDGVATPGASGTGASADIAEMMGWPVLLVLDPSGQAQTAAAVAPGSARFPQRACASRASCSIASRARGTKTSCARAMEAPASPCSARCRGMRRSHCRSGISAWCRRRSMPRSNELIAEAARLVAERVDLDAVLRLAECGVDRDRAKSRRRA